MTLHEQYKERISNCKKERNCKDEYCTSCYADEYIKQSFLDSIDCMIAREQNLNPTFGGSLDKKSAMFASNKRGEYNLIWLSEQRDLIANEL